jgi:hypothetical protein
MTNRICSDRTTVRRSKLTAEKSVAERRILQYPTITIPLVHCPLGNARHQTCYPTSRLLDPSRTYTIAPNRGTPPCPFIHIISRSITSSPVLPPTTHFSAFDGSIIPSGSTKEGSRVTYDHWVLTRRRRCRVRGFPRERKIHVCMWRHGDVDWDRHFRCSKAAHVTDRIFVQ